MSSSTHSASRIIARNATRGVVPVCVGPDEGSRTQSRLRLLVYCLDPLWLELGRQRCLVAAYHGEEAYTRRCRNRRWPRLVECRTCASDLRALSLLLLVRCPTLAGGAGRQAWL